ncbi:uncharacterized protein BX663DRAFT_540936 [Cokeromyces recurvatus]|uniref:uncharacterized protein n=1 Tax=Cokeromyces recurvatus TaxID=90255 RepID=UPI00221EB0BB|nr:uncharacterized protein BX663DRAFT_540936 [Cokeromyces recurvatus]KAI7905465.1 hypothetical protein BX663DRAFT_540936 [Cokeromyces recurvatus]
MEMQYGIPHSFINILLNEFNSGNGSSSVFLGQHTQCIIKLLKENPSIALEHDLIKNFGLEMIIFSLYVHLYGTMLRRANVKSIICHNSLKKDDKLRPSRTDKAYTTVAQKDCLSWKLSSKVVHRKIYLHLQQVSAWFHRLPTTICYCNWYLFTEGVTSKQIMIAL